MTRRLRRLPPCPTWARLRLQFVQQTPAWIAADPADAERRRAAAAAFLVELAAARLESDWGRLSDLIEWTCAQILRAPTRGSPTPFERSWHMATTALAGRARARLWLLGPYARLPASEAVETRTAKRRSAEPAAPDARDRTLPRRSRVPAGARDRVDVGTRFGADAEHPRGLAATTSTGGRRRGRRSSRPSPRSSR